MSADINIDYEAVNTMASGFQTASDTMENVSQALEVAINILKASAFLGLAGAAALAVYLEGIKPNLDRLAATCEEMSGDLSSSVTALQEGDQSGSAKFNM